MIGMPFEMYEDRVYAEWKRGAWEWDAFACVWRNKGGSVFHAGSDYFQQREEERGRMREQMKREIFLQSLPRNLRIRITGTPREKEEARMENFDERIARRRWEKMLAPLVFTRVIAVWIGAACLTLLGVLAFSELLRFTIERVLR